MLLAHRIGMALGVPAVTILKADPLEFGVYLAQFELLIQQAEGVSHGDG